MAIFSIRKITGVCKNIVAFWLEIIKLRKKLAGSFMNIVYRKHQNKINWLAPYFEEFLVWLHLIIVWSIILETQTISCLTNFSKKHKDCKKIPFVLWIEIKLALNGEVLVWSDSIIRCSIISENTDEFNVSHPSPDFYSD